MKKIAFLFFASASITTTLQAQTAKPKTTAKAPVKTTATASVNPLKNLKDSVAYILGTSIGNSLQRQNFTDINLDVVKRAMADALAHKTPLINDETANNVMSSYQAKIQGSKSAANKAAGQKFLDANAKRPGVKVLPDGLQYEIITAGSDSTKPSLTDSVTCHYHGTLIDGTVFDSSVDRGEPITFQLGGVIRGWQEALQLMSVGSKWKLYIPSSLAYGDSPAGPTIGGGSTLIFQVELLAVKKGQ
ncbi:FKBP-type peptidyl-prolyl cis-trans isomerase [Chitinophagaceae bacterium LWZ2-11]